MVVIAGGDAGLLDGGVCYALALNIPVLLWTYSIGIVATERSRQMPIDFRDLSGYRSRVASGRRGASELEL